MDAPRLKASLAMKPDTADFRTRHKSPIGLPSPPLRAAPCCNGGNLWKVPRRTKACRQSPEPADQRRPAISGAFAVGMGLSLIGFVNIRGTAARLRTTHAGTATPFISQMAYSDWGVILAEFGA